MIVAAVLLSLCAQNAPGTELGLELVPWSKKVGERRYESPRDYDGTVKHFRDKLKGWKQIKWTREVSLPAVKYVHIENTSDASKWQGVNIYEFPDGRVRYFILDRPKKAPPPPAAAAAPTAPPSAPPPAAAPPAAAAPAAPAAPASPKSN